MGNQERIKEMKRRTYNVRGRIRFEKNVDKEKLTPRVYARIGHRTVASAPVDIEGGFNLKFERVGTAPPSSLTLIVGPPVSESMLTHANTKQIPISSEEWKESGKLLLVEKDIMVEKDLIICMLPREIKICGVVCKEIPIAETGLTRCCPVPFAKVEVFDVDSLLSIKSIKAKPVKSIIASDKFRKIPEEVFEIPERYNPPGHVPGPFEKRMMVKNMMGTEEMPISAEKSDILDYTVGKVNIADSYAHIPFYTKDKLGEVYTDECGEFCLTFTWFPGCISPDVSPDLIFKVSQTYTTSNGPVTYTIYSEGYSDTRWDVPDYHWVKLDAADGVLVSCNPDCHPLLDRRALFMGVGNQGIYADIAQEDDAPKACGFVYNGNFVKSPFGETLDIRGVFGSKVEETGERLYRISYAKIPDCNSKPDDDSIAWTPITDALIERYYYWDSSVGALHYDNMALGPHSLPGHANPEFYKIRNTQDDYGHDIYWFDHNRIAEWETDGKIPDGLYVLKIEVFDSDGNPDPAVYIGDDLGKYAYMCLHINNKKPHVEIKGIFNGGSLINMQCGAFDHLIGEEVKFLVDAYHEDDHLLYWSMSYQIGYGSAKGTVASDTSGYTVEDFRGKDNEFIVWEKFDENFGLTTIPPSTCSTFGVAIELAVCTKTTNGYDFLKSKHEHYKEVHAGLAVHHAEEEG
ncbi:MAG: hypothetical protein EF812_05825 [Methanosarcinales archaeon]|nr:MAG: hypothetical protein EF812_05825 [Methanosarcinales archaeon]